MSHEELMRRVEQARLHTTVPRPDVRGKVVAVVGDRIAVWLDDDSAPVPQDLEMWWMAIYSAGIYKGELQVVESYAGHALGRVVMPRGPAIRVGDRAACRVP